MLLPTYNNGSLSAESTSERRPFLEWESVPYAFGYIIQLKNGRGEIVHMQMVQGTNRLALELKPGMYFHRITALNMFHRKAGWSKWKKFEVSTRVSRNRIVAGAVDNRPTLSAERKVRARTSQLPLWQRLIPGLSLLHEGRRTAGYTFLGVAGFAAITGLFAWNRNNQPGRSNDAIGSIYSDATVYLALRSRLQANPDWQSLGFVARENNLRDRAAYDRNSRLQGGAALLGLIVYFFHVKHEFWNGGRSLSHGETHERKSRIAVSVSTGPRKDPRARIAVQLRY